MGQKDSKQNQLAKEEKPVKEIIPLYILKERYYNILKEMEQRYTFFSVNFFNMSYPSFIYDERVCPTSQIRADRISKELVYDWNVQFFGQLTDEEVMFVIAHETFHVLLDHLKLISSLEFPQIGNIACDAVINDLLVKQFNFTIPEGLVTGQNLLKEDCSDKSAEYVYNKILSEKIIVPVYVTIDYQQGVSGEEMEGIEGNSDSQAKEAIVGKGSKSSEEKDEEGDKEEAPKPIDNHENWTEEDSEILSENIPIAYDESSHEVTQRGFAAGNMEFAIQKVKNKFDLKKLVKNIVGKRLKEEFNENWRKYNYKLSYVYPDVILPYQDSNEVTEKLGLLFCIDTSGSISDILIQEFIAIAKNHLEDFDVTAVTFDTKIYEIDLKKSKTAYGRGGTSFQAIADYVVENKDKDFDAVMVLTDSFGGTIKETSKLNFKKWYWVITPYGEKVPDYMGKSFFIPKDYVKY